MYSHRNLAYLLVALGGLPACSSDTSGEGEIASAETNSQALTAVNVVAGFESLSAWSATSAARTLTTDHVEARECARGQQYQELHGARERRDERSRLRRRRRYTADQAAGRSRASLVEGAGSTHASTHRRAAFTRRTSAKPSSTASLPEPTAPSASACRRISAPALSTGSIADVRYQLTLACRSPLGPYLLDAPRVGGPISDPTPTPTP